MSSCEKSNPAAIAALLGPPPLLNGESAELYNQLLTRVVAAHGVPRTMSSCSF